MPDPAPSYPGVFIEEKDAAVHTITGVATRIAAFIGSAKKGSINRPVRVASFEEFTQHFGPLLADCHLGYAVGQFFLNGGTDAIVVRIAKKPSAAKILAGIRALDAIDLFDLLVLPGIAVPATIAAAADYCRTRRAFLIVDPPEDARTPAAVEAFVQHTAFPKSPDAALYFPWTKVSDPLNNGHPRAIPPGGTVAGLIARTDAVRGVWKSPAGPDASLTGVKSLDYNLTDAESDPLNARGINCLRTFPNFGSVAWGARTLAGDDTLASEWKYLGVRRLALFLEESISRGTAWAVFEANAEPLWSQLRTDIENFLLGLFRAGAFQGRTQREAFFVKCDRQTMTDADIANGLLIIQIGVAPLRPAEFVIIQIQQCYHC